MHGRCSAQQCKARCRQRDVDADGMGQRVPSPAHAYRCMHGCMQPVWCSLSSARTAVASRARCAVCCKSGALVKEGVVFKQAVALCAADRQQRRAQKQQPRPPPRLLLAILSTFHVVLPAACNPHECCCLQRCSCRLQRCKQGGQKQRAPPFTLLAYTRGHKMSNDEILDVQQKANASSLVGPLLRALPRQRRQPHTPIGHQSKTKQEDEAPA